MIDDWNDLAGKRISRCTGGLQAATHHELGRVTRFFDDRKSRRERLADVIAAPWFNYIIMALIILNAVLLGIEIDVGAKLATSEIPAWYDTVNIVIVCIFVLAPRLFRP